MEARANRPVRDIKDLGDLSQGEIHEVVEDDDRPLVAAQLVEGATELVSLDDLGEVVASGGQFVGQIDDLDPSSAVPASLGPTSPDDESVRPGVEALRVAEAGQVLPDRHQGLLDDVLGGMRVAEDPAGDQEEAARCAPSQLLVRLAIAMLRPLDQCRVHPSLSALRPAPVGRSLY